ncbi:MAG: hypothetical protein F6K09_01110 [Merismopedia sp. SIO2A8]|nr:hypothetical protein [Symploca sp. SIO2B6]NET47327.1 hypothetical protein [Merismopedia sp. SIO2A8]
MVAQICFTGSRKLTTNIEKLRVISQLKPLRNDPRPWHVGDASGVDELVRQKAKDWGKEITIYEVEGKEKWHFAKRSQKMILSSLNLGDTTVFVFPDKLCPTECTLHKPFSGHGSGTWGTAAYAYNHGAALKIYPLFSLRDLEENSWFPEWTEVKQLELF